MEKSLHKFGNWVLELIWILEFGIWSFHSIGMGLFFKILHKGPIVHGLQNLEGYIAIGTENHIAM